MKYGFLVNNERALFARIPCNYTIKVRVLSFLDADDYWSADKLASQLAFHLKHPDCVLSFTDYMHFNEQNEDIIGCFDYWPEFKCNKK